MNLPRTSHRGAFRARLLLTATLACGLPALGLQSGLLAAEAPTASRHFDLNAGPAAENLRRAATQAGCQILFRAELLAGLQTPALHGDYSAAEALKCLLKDLKVYPVWDDKAEAFLLRREDSSSPAEPASSQPNAQSRRTGSIGGRILEDGSGRPLSGAHLAVEGTTRETYADAYGFYTLNDLPEGEYSLEVSYVGASSSHLPIRVSGDATTPQRYNAQLSLHTYELEKVVVTEHATGLARALNERRGAATYTDVVAADAIGKFPDQNAAESLQRVPGLALYRDQGEGRFVIIRGVNYQYNAVSINGSRAATPEKGTRSVPLDTIGSESIAALEINKVTTPDMEGDSLGGSVNIRTRSAFDSDGHEFGVNGSWLYSHQEGLTGYRFGASMATIGLDGKLGLFVGASMQKRPFSSWEYEESAGWTNIAAASSPDGTQHALFNTVDLRHYEPLRTRNSGNISLDYRVNPCLQLYFRSVLSDYDDTEHRWATSIPFSTGKLTALSDYSATSTGIKGVQKRDRERDEDRRLASGTLGFNAKTDGWTTDGSLAYSDGSETRDAVELRYDTTATSNFSYSFSDPYRISVIQTGGTDINDPSGYKLSSKSNYTQQIGSETEKAAHLNVRRDFNDSTLGFWLKGGVSARLKDKSQDANKTAFTAVPFSLKDIIEGDTVYPFMQGLRIRSDAPLSWYDNKAGFTTTNALSDAWLSDFSAKENILATYLLGGFKTGDLSVSTGLRAEQTHFRTDGYALSNSTVLSPVSGGRNYGNLLPGLYLRDDLGKNLVLRASWSNTLSRAPYEYTLLSRTVDDTKLQVSQGNPSLLPMQSRNYDASLEYYLPPLGLLSVAVFRKELRDFSYQDATGIDSLTGYTLTTYRNGPTGLIQGLELAWQQKLGFLPAPLNGLGIESNLTLSDSHANYPSRPGERLWFIGQSKTIANLALTYENHGLFARVALNYRSPRLREDTVLGTDPSTDRYVDRFYQIDASLGYKLTKSVELFSEWTNLNNAAFKVYFGGPGPKHLVQREEYGWTCNTGIRCRF